MKKYQRKAMSYILVLGTAMVITMIGISALSTMRLRWHSTKNSTDFLQTRLYAQSAIDMGLFYIENTPGWRSVRPSGLWVDRDPIGNGYYSITGVDPNDNNLSNSANDPVILTGIGYQGDARYKLQVTLLPELVPISALEAAMQAGNDIIFETSTLTSNKIISSNNSIAATNSTINADVEAANSIVGTGYTGNTTYPVPPRIMPSANVFDYYLANGTPITYNILPSALNIRLINNIVLSQNVNPYGNQITNPQGIYVIDCAGQNIKIMNSRIVGTLLLINPGSESIILNSINWEPAVPNYPILLVNGSFKIGYSNVPLSEQVQGNVNYNPPGTPYDGVSDTDISDEYPSETNGLIYVSGDLLMYNEFTMKGVVIAGNTLTIQHPNSTPNTIIINYDNIFYYNPPPGFSEIANMIIAERSWKQVVD